MPGDKAPAATSVARSKPIPFEDRPTVVVIAGPTAAGKSGVALDLAARIGGTIINADASQLYAHLRVLTARPSEADAARVPHVLYGVLNGAEPCSAARWADLAREAIVASLATGRTPIVTGGSGLYLRALLDGVAPVPPIDPELRAAVRALDSVAARAALAALDPAAAARLFDPQRIARALEVVSATGRTLAGWQAEPGDGIAPSVDLRAFVVDRPRPELHVRIDARLEAMIAAGVVDEVAALVARNLPVDAPVMKALGVASIAAALRGEIGLATAIERLRHDTRRYAKRQQTWFRNQTGTWLRVVTDDLDIISKMEDSLIQ